LSAITDCPRFLSQHTDDATLKMNEIGRETRFKTFLTVWTNTNAGVALPALAPNQQAGERTYYDVQRYDWRLDARYSVDTATGNETTISDNSKIILGQGGANLTTREFSPISSANATINHHETRPPALFKVLGFDRIISP